MEENLGSNLTEGWELIETNLTKYFFSSTPCREDTNLEAIFLVTFFGTIAIVALVAITILIPRIRRKKK